MKGLPSLLISYARRTIFKINDSTTHKTVSGQQSLHHFVVGMRIYAKTRTAGKAPVEAERTDTPAGAVRSQTMNHMIRPVIRPGSVFDIGISGVRPRNETEGSHHSPLFRFTHITPGLRYLTSHQFTLRVTGHPLPWIAGVSHKTLGRGEDFHQTVQIVHDGFPNIQLHKFLF